MYASLMLKLIRTNIYLSLDMLKRLRSLAEERDISVAELVRRIIKRALR